MNICLFDEKEIKNPLQKNDERAKHILKVLHKSEGDTFDAGIIGGAAGSAKITKITENGEIFFDFEAKSEGKPLYPLTLVIGFPRPIQLRRLLRDVAGLGCKKVILTGTDLTEKSYLDSNVVTDGSAYQMLLDGTAQAASTHVPELVFFKNLDETLSVIARSEATKQSQKQLQSINEIASPSARNDEKKVASNDNRNGMLSKIALDNRRAKMSLHDFLKRENVKTQEVFAAIGSERGWTERERNLLEKFGFTLCSMGTRVLRTETAATVASSIILDAMGFLN